jgi:glycosyltransferase involved in cell wall biosynthesis
MRHDDPRVSLLQQRVEASNFFHQRLTGIGAASVTLQGPFFAPFGNGPQMYGVGGVQVLGTPTVAFPYIEMPDYFFEHAEGWRRYDRIVVASEWNRQLMREIGIEAMLIHQAVDTTIFHPGVRKPRQDGRFRVFSGGKCEPRKGQDLVLEAFGRFAECHDDAVLVAAWASPWPELIGLWEGQCRYGAPALKADGMPDFAEWAGRFGVHPQQLEFLPLTPNCLLPDILATIDCSLFLSRAEGGCNQAALECLACKIPTLLSPGHGHDDIAVWAGYTASTVDDVVEWLEDAYHGSVAPPGEIPDAFTWPTRVAGLQKMLRDFA